MKDVEEQKTQTSNDGIIYENIDKGVSPKNDFFNFVNGNWIKNANIPEDKSAWGTFYELQEQTDDQLKSVFKSLTNEDGESSYEENSDEWKAMKYYEMAMDTKTIEKNNLSVCNKFLSMIDSCSNINDLLALSMANVPMKNLFHLYPSSDPDNSDAMIAGIWQGGMVLPEKSFYFDSDKKAKDIREKYLVLLGKLFVLLGFDSNKSIIQSKLKLQIETDIAEISKGKVELRDPIANTNKIKLSGVIDLCPNVDWKKIFTELNIDSNIEIDVGQPDFLRGLNILVTKYTLDEWKKFYKSNFLLSYYPYLNSEVENIIFDFFGKVLNGTQEMEPRWKRKQRLVCSDLRDAIGKIYVQKYFPESSKKKMLEIVENIRAAFLIRLENNGWMTNGTKEKAIDKLNAMIFKIGFPDRWNDYSGLQILDSFLETGIEMTKFDTLYGEQGLDKIGKPKDKTVWHMGPYVVNAYYNPTVNENVFPAGILQSPFFDIDADDAINYGAIGAVIAHEMTHGFDDSGRHFGKSGNLKEWWTEDDSKNFNKLTKKVISQYDSYEALPGLKLNGQLVLGEAIADLGGLTISYDAYSASLKEKGIDINEYLDGEVFSHKQKFFIGFAQVWNGVRRDESLRTIVKTDPHPPGKFRVLGTLSNMESFYSAFDIKSGDGMFLEPELRGNIW